MDLWIEPNNENKLKLLEVLKEFEFNKEGINHIESLDFTRHLAFYFWEIPERVDCLTHISNVKFNEAYEQKILADFDGFSIPIIHYNHFSCQILQQTD